MHYLKKRYKSIVAMIVMSLMFDVIVADDVFSETKPQLDLPDEQTKKNMMGEKVINGNSPSTNKVDHLSSKIKVRLNLTDEQAEKFEPIFLDNKEKRLGVMKKYGIKRDSASFGEKIGLRQLRAIKKDMDKINKQTENQLADVLSKEQLDEYKKIQEEQRIEMRSRLKNNNTWKK